ncbi:hypothetical protein GGS20DRAFT_558850 [Poronia punctata]|nr:hypothetical protein GGS20DRAFT_558850 [Poronia punctata]
MLDLCCRGISSWRFAQLGGVWTPRAAAQQIASGVRVTVTEEIQQDCQRIRTLLTAAQILGEIPNYCLEAVVSMCDKLSAKLLCAILRDRGIWAKYLGLTESMTCLRKGKKMSQKSSIITQVGSSLPS